MVSDGVSTRRRADRRGRLVDLLAEGTMMAEPTLLGQFLEFGLGESAPSIRDALGRLDDEERIIVADYLAEGIALTAVPGYDLDVLDGELVLMSSSLVTDSVFVWRRDLSHYVRKYGVELPDSFVQRVLAGAEPPAELDEDRFADVVGWVSRYLRGKTW